MEYSSWVFFLKNLAKSPLDRNLDVDGTNLSRRVFLLSPRCFLCKTEFSAWVLS